MKKYEIKITSTFVYYVDITANNKKEAIEKAKDYYENVDDGVTGVADGNSYEGTKFTINVR